MAGRQYFRTIPIISDVGACKVNVEPNVIIEEDIIYEIDDKRFKKKVAALRLNLSIISRTKPGVQLLKNRLVML